jgi:subtilase family serine protease
VSLFLKRLSTTLSLCAALLAPAFAATTVQTHPQITVRPAARITEAVDTKKLTTLTGSHPSRLDGMTDMGRVSTGTQFNHMLLVLKSSDAQEFALQALLDQQQDRSHANFHQWATPDTFGAAFGVESSDIEQVTAWLQQSGFTVNSVSKSGRLIDFSGTSGAVESAFHTEMHQYQVNGETRMSNTSDVSIPSALTTVVVGPARLNNFRPTSYSVGARKATIGKNGKVTSATALATGRTPLWSDGAGDNFVGAADLQVIYDAAPMYAKGIDGTGVTIGLIGQTDILPQDDQMYRSIFGLPPNPVTRIQVGDDPGTIPDDVESDLDVELAGSLGYNANIEFITSGNSTVGGGTDSSAVYLVDQNAVDIMSYSYGGCETDYTAASTGGPNINALYNTLWEQAAAQGQSVFVSTGDSGADVCADGRTSATPTGYSVNGLASTPYDVAVGGTEFNESLDTSGATFWGGPSLAVPFESAMSYIPEVPWDESAYGITPFIGTTTIDTDGGGLTAESSGISFFYGTPSWQTGPGVPTTDPTPTEGSIPPASYVVAGPHRYLPDVSANAAVYQDPTMFCSEGICQLNADGTLANAGLVGGTSVAAPTMASVQALINQANGRVSRTTTTTGSRRCRRPQRAIRTPTLRLKPQPAVSTT